MKDEDAREYKYIEYRRPDGTPLPQPGVAPWMPCNWNKEKLKMSDRDTNDQQKADQDMHEELQFRERDPEYLAYLDKLHQAKTL